MINMSGAVDELLASGDGHRWKDIRAELRTKDIFSSMFVFALLSVIVFSFAFELRVPSMTMSSQASSGCRSLLRARWG